MKRFPNIVLVFIRVDWPIFMRRKMLFALARLLKRYDSCAVAVNRPLCPFTTSIRKPDRMQEYFGKPGIEKLDDNLYQYSPRYFITDMIANKVPPLEEINLKRLRESYKYLCSEIGIDEPNPLIWFYHPQQGYLTKLFENSFTIMELCDNLVYYDGNKSEEVDRQEKQLRTDVDLLLATSPKLLEKYGSHYKHAWLSGNGLDKQIYERLSRENINPRPELIKIPAPRIGYTGIISKRLDWELIEQIASRKPEWNFLFVGPFRKNAPLDKIKNYSNVHFTGKYEHTLMPEVLKSFDVGFMPYKDNEFFRYSNPLKFYEFAAAGLCSVSSEMEILSKFDPRFVKIVPNNADEWITAIDNML
ncbi:MAG: glycosyltransferase, partial [candidate division Zixibacteria bacterium]|nr:glycosyltransferase [candidate division Zixibacteria bacterium]